MKRKNKLTNIYNLTTDEIVEKFSDENLKFSRKSVLLPILALCIAIPSFCVFHSFRSMPSDVSNNITLLSVPVASTSTKDMISIPAGIVKQNPFLPYRSIDKGNTNVSDMPPLEILEPPESLSEHSEAARIMDTVVSGILYDKYSPSAILNIEGKDYLVKKGDEISNYKVVSILQDSVTVKLGNNTYKAGIGEILTEGTINYNEVPNLNTKFGGERR